MSPTRRALLAALTAGIAGCSGDRTRSPTGRSTDAPTETVTATPTEPSTPAETESPTETPISEPRRVELDDDRLRWRVDFPGDRIREPAVDQGHLYVATGDDPIVTDTAERLSGSLTALGLPEGAIDWHQSLDDPPTGDPRVHDGSVFLDIGRSTGFDGLGQRLVRVDADGTERWQSPQRDAFLYVLGVNGDGVYLGTGDDQVGPQGEQTFAVDRVTGEERWAVEGGDPFAGRVDGDTLYADYASRAVAALATADGSDRWRRAARPLHAGDESFPMAAGLLFATVETDKGYGIAGLDAADGSTAWIQRPDGDSRYVASSVATVGETVVATEAHDMVTAREASTGEPHWDHSFAERVAAPLAVDGTVYAPVVDGSVAAVDIASGDLLWHESVAADGYPQLHDSGGTLLAVISGQEETTVSAVDVGDGTSRWRRTVPADLAGATLADGRLLLVTDAGSVYGVAV